MNDSASDFSHAEETPQETQSHESQQDSGAPSLTDLVERRDTHGSTDRAEHPEWYWARGEDGESKGAGEPPDWFNHKTFKSVEEQAKAHTELRKLYNTKLKGHSGAPEERYSYKFSDEMSEKGYAYDLENPYYKDFLDYAQEQDLSQEVVTNLTDMLIDSVNTAATSEQEASSNTQEQELSLLSNGEQQAFEDAVRMAANNNSIEKDNLNDLLDGLTTAASIKAFTSLANTFSTAPMPRSNAVNPYVDPYDRQLELRERLAKVSKMSGRSYTEAKAKLDRDYEREYEHNRR